MRALLALLLALSLFGLAPAAQAAPRAHGALVVAACADDGRAGATAGTGTYASLRAGWAFPPTCFVADVDYNVGADCTNIVCTSPAGTLPAGWSWNGTSHLITYSDTGSPSTLQNIDCRGVGGCGVNITGGSNVTVSNLWATFACAGQGIVSQPAANNVTLTGVTMDGLDLVGSGCTSDFGELINLKNTGQQKVVYTRVINATQHSISFTCNADGGAGTVYARYNSISRAGNQQGGHANGTEWVNGSVTPGAPPCNYAYSDFQWNFYYNPQPDTPLESGVLTVDTTINSREATLHFAGAIYSQTSLLVGMTLTSANIPASTTLTRVDNASANPTVQLSVNATATATGTSAGVPNAYPFGLFQPIRYVTQNPTSGSLFNGIIRHNVAAGSGPIKGTVSMIGCSNSKGGPNNDVVLIDGNYLQLSGAVNIFTGAGVGDLACSRLSGTGNKDLDTGNTLTVP